ncbi:hypothetical protein ACNOYE_31000 [Nannocystaceae bacterium ST9]
MSALARIVLIGLLGTSGCLKPNPLAIGFAESDASETDASSEATNEESDASESGEPPSDLPEDVGTTDTTSSDTDSSDTGSSDTGSSDTAACETPPELEAGCGACLAASCCTSLSPCGDDPICVCLADCKFAGMSNNQCKMLCGKKPADVEPLAPLLACATQDCPDCFAL